MSTNPYERTQRIIERPRIVQIVAPNPPIYAAYADDDGSVYRATLPILWALDTEGDIVAVDSDADGWVDHASKSVNFAGMVLEDVTNAELAELAAEFKARHKKGIKKDDPPQQ